LLVRIHVYRERKPELVREKKARVLEQTGRLACESCGFDFERVYGDIGKGFAECHHRTPISQLRPGDRTRLEDLAIVCPNCHRMLHRTEPMVSVQALGDWLRARQAEFPLREGVF